MSGRIAKTLYVVEEFLTKPMNPQKVDSTKVQVDKSGFERVYVTLKAVNPNTGYPHLAMKPEVGVTSVLYRVSRNVSARD
jgi:hypothetical protein